MLTCSDLKEAATEHSGNWRWTSNILHSLASGNSSDKTSLTKISPVLTTNSSSAWRGRMTLTMKVSLVVTKVDKDHCIQQYLFHT